MQIVFHFHQVNLAKFIMTKTGLLIVYTTVKLLKYFQSIGSTKIMYLVKYNEIKLKLLIYKKTYAKDRHCIYNIILFFFKYFFYSSEKRNSSIHNHKRNSTF